MENKNNKILIIIIFVLLALYIPFSLGLLKNRANLPSPVSFARWDVSADFDLNGSMHLVPNSGTSSYSIVVSSDSEVDTDYSIIVSNIPSGVQVKLDNDEFQPYSSTVTFSNAGTILYGAGVNSATHTISFRANTGAPFVNNQSVGVNVEFKQKM
ncbi:MAG: hypothetical protein IKI04_00045 [Bacilli bacterium]|nr:hypothetical protein [Bacilli bacterium]